MSKYKYTYQVEFYSTDGIIKNIYIDARTRQEALEIASKAYKIIELITCRRIDTY